MGVPPMGLTWHGRPAHEIGAVTVVILYGCLKVIELKGVVDLG